MSQLATIDGLAFARNAMEARGRLGLESMPRLAQSGCSASAFGFVLNGEINQRGKPGLRLAVDGTVRLECQRCLEGLDLPLRFEVQLELVSSEAEIMAADDEDDVDRILTGREMDVAALIEDEVLLALPMVPKHEHCKAAAALEGNARPSLFEGLAVLKKLSR